MNVGKGSQGAPKTLSLGSRVLQLPLWQVKMGFPLPQTRVDLVPRGEYSSPKVDGVGKWASVEVFRFGVIPSAPLDLIKCYFYPSAIGSYNL